MFRTVSLSIIRSPALYTQHNLYDLYLLLCVQCRTPDDGQRYCPKHVEFYSESKFQKLVFLVGFSIRIYHDAWSSECQKQNSNLLIKKNSVAMIYDRCIVLLHHITLYYMADMKVLEYFL